MGNTHTQNFRYASTIGVSTMKLKTSERNVCKVLIIPDLNLIGTAPYYYAKIIIIRRDDTVGFISRM